jgi:3-oxoadipate enol-lactonase
MKNLILVLVIVLCSMPILQAQNMQQLTVTTQLGKIAVQVKEVSGTIPIIFLHGVYFDRHLWNYQTSRINDRTVITLDMPLHGDSDDITISNWTLEDCADMLLEILDSLEVEKVIAIGHSWGSMTILRAAARSPERFQAIGLCNMPLEAGNRKIRRKFRSQYLVLPFRRFYTKQVAKALYARQSLDQDPELVDHLDRSMSILSNGDIKYTDLAVIMNADDGEAYLRNLEIPAIALKGEDDYVPVSEHLHTWIVAGGHVSPLEAPEQVFVFIQEVLGKKNAQLIDLLWGGKELASGKQITSFGQNTIEMLLFRKYLMDRLDPWQ